MAGSRRYIGPLAPGAHAIDPRDPMPGSQR